MPRIVAVAAVAAVATSLAACGGDKADSEPSDASKVPTIVVGHYIGGTPGMATVGLDFVAENTEVQKKHNIKVKAEHYTSISDLYADLARGRIDLATTGPASSASMVNEGAPVALAGTVAHATNVAMSVNKKWTVEEVRGSRIVAQANSSSWKSVRAGIELHLGLVGDKDYKILNADSTAAAAIQAASGKADYAIVRAEQVRLAQLQFPNLKVVGTAEQLSLVPGKVDWGYIVAYNTTKMDAEAGRRFMDALVDVTKLIQANPDEAEAKAVAGGLKPGIAREFISSGDVNYDVQKIDQARDSLQKEFEVLVKYKALDKLPPASIFGS